MPTRPHPLGLVVVRRLAVALGVVVVVLGTLVGSAGALGPRQVDDLLVDGPADDSLSQSEVAPQPEVVPSEVTAADDDVVAGDDDEAEAKVRRIMYALVAIAALLAVLTAFYWWYTRPSRRGRMGAGTVGTWQTDSTSTR